MQMPMKSSEGCSEDRPIESSYAHSKPHTLLSRRPVNPGIDIATHLNIVTSFQ